MRKLTLNIDVLFQISRVGDDHGAKAFIKELKNDPDLKGILHCTSCMTEAEDLFDTNSNGSRSGS